jgi:DNA-binding XRE family transcriptional regulator
MTGSEFEKLMKDHGYNQTTLAVRWGVVRQTIGSCCKSEAVDPLYADAIKAIAFEQQAAKLMDIVSLFNTNNEKS